MIEYSIRAGRRSAEAEIPARIIYVDNKLIGTHEQVHPTRVERMAKDLLLHGYRWPSVVVFQAGSDELFGTAVQNERLDLAYGDIGVAEGHHRLAALRLIADRGLLKEPYIPVQLVPAHDSGKVRNIVSEPGQAQLSIGEIEACFRTPDQNFSPHTTSFYAVLKTGEWVSIKESQFDMFITLTQLLSRQGQQL